MSLILDALKKLDREKAAKRGGTVNVASGILLQVKARRRGMALPLAAILFTAVGLAAATYFWAGAPSLPFGVSQTAATSPSSVVKTTPAVPAVPPVAKQELPAEPKPAPSVEPGKQQIASPPPPAAEAKKPFEKSRTKAPAATEAIRVPERNGNTAPSVRPVLKVSGIVWQEERPARLAFVNDIRVREGDMIKDVKVVEIHPDRVRFSQSGKVFDVRLFE
ncbi:MAG TPA: general secretion pathway protein GspB [Syntrophales bacterium]|nr:general secretion pathway protein GspB [Syntrophales bacterium]